MITLVLVKIYQCFMAQIRGKTVSFHMIYRVCYLARARAMARVVLAQIEFARAICGSRKILPMLH